MKRHLVLAFGLAVFGSTFASLPAFADADDAAWIKRCVSDNAGEGQTAETVAVYCSCMNGKMSSSETQSI